MAEDFDQVVVENDSIKNRYLTFTIDNDEYGIEISKILDVINMKPVTKVPQNPDYIEGIINLRGDIIGILNVRKRFLKPYKEPDDFTCIVVIEHGGYELGLIVDNVNDVLTIDEDNISPPPNAKLNHYNRYIRNIGRHEDKIKLLLDLDKLLTTDEY